MTSENGGRWLLLVHQLPARPSNLRVTIWRRLQRLGAVALRNAVYVLPNTAEAREDFEWLRTEIAGLGGAATVMAANSVNEYSDEELVQQFRVQRQRDYVDLMRDGEQLVKRWRTAKRPIPRPAARREAHAMRERYARIRAMDYFNANNSSAAADVVRQLETLASDVAPLTANSAGRAGLDHYRANTWVTRARPGIDRMASAWLIRKYIDPDARFAFVASPEQAPSNNVPFDMYGVEFGHHGARCTMETLMERFTISDAATMRLSQVVHDLDLKETTYGLPECAATSRLVDGLRQLYADDQSLLAQGMILMEALHCSFASEQSEKEPRPGPRSGRRQQLRPKHK